MRAGDGSDVQILNGQVKTFMAAQWPTPDAGMYAGSNRSPSDGAAIRPAITLAAQQWPTPAQRDGDARRGATNPESDAWKNKVSRGAVNAAGMLSDDLTSSATHWPTPVTSDAKSQLGGGHERPDGCEDAGPEPVAGRDALPLFAPGPADHRWPGILAEHPELAPALEPSFRKLVNGLAFAMDDSRAARLKCVGNGVVPAQAGVAFVLLARRMMSSEPA